EKEAQVARRLEADPVVRGARLRKAPASSAGHGAMVAFEDVAAGNIRLGVVLGTELGDVHAVLAALDFFYEHVDAEVVPCRQWHVAPGQEELDEPRAGRVAAHLVAQFEGQRVADERFVLIRGVEDPVGFGREAEWREFELVAIAIARLESHGGLRQAQGGVAAALDITLAVEVGGTAKRRALAGK